MVQMDYLSKKVSKPGYPRHPIGSGPGLWADFSLPSYKGALEFEAMGCVVRYAQNSFSSLSTPALDCLLELAPHAPFSSPRSHQPAFLHASFIITPGPRVLFCSMLQKRLRKGLA